MPASGSHVKSYCMIDVSSFIGNLPADVCPFPSLVIDMQRTCQQHSGTAMMLLFRGALHVLINVLSRHASCVA